MDVYMVILFTQKKLYLKSIPAFTVDTLGFREKLMIFPKNALDAQVEIGIKN
jgi:hypothetical protein